MKQSTVLIDEEIDCIANEIIKEVETASSKDLSQANYTKKNITMIGSSLHNKTITRNRKRYIWISSNN